MDTTPAFSGPLDAAACYAALQAHDARFDGVFFVGISSTGVYCRPVCRVRTPRFEHCAFFAAAAAAERAGYRPCLKCRPECAPGSSPMDAASGLARRAALLLDGDDADAADLPELARRLGVTDRHLRRVFAAAYGVTPVAYRQTRRLLLAKQLLTETRLPVTEVAFAAGFASLRRFNHLFKTRCRLTPGQCRRFRPKTADDPEHFTLFLHYRPPFAWEPLLAFLGGRAIPGVEQVANDVYRRTVSLPGAGKNHRGWLAVSHEPQRHAVAVRLSTSLAPVLSPVVTRLRRLFDLDCRPDVIAERLGSLRAGGKPAWTPGLRLPGCFDPFEMAVRAILGQQITVKAARTLAGRFAAAFGEPMATPFDALALAFPDAARIASLPSPPEGHMGPLGIIGARARSIHALARALVDGTVTLGRGVDPEAEMTRLRALPGFGDWTAQYVGMRALGWPDAFPATDYGVKKAMGGMGVREMAARAQAWRPWRSYATMALWQSL